MDENTIPLKINHADELSVGHLENSWGEKFHYRALFDQTGECVFIIGLDLRYIAANQRALDFLGYTEQELIGMYVSEIVALDDELGRASLISLSESSDLYERFLNKKDGYKLPVEISTSIVYNELGRPVYIQSIARDISERKAAERNLKRQARVLSVISDATARLLRTSNIETKLPEVLESLGRALDAGCCAIFEINTFSDEPEINIHYQWLKPELNDFQVAPVLKPILPTLLAEPGHYFSPQQLKDQPDDSSKISMAVVPIERTLGSAGFLGIFDQSTDLLAFPSERDAIQTAADLIGSALQRNRFEETIRLNEERNRIMINALPDLLIRIDNTCKILDYNANIEHPLYIHRDLISGRKLTQIWPIQIVSQLIGAANQQGFTSSTWVRDFRLPGTTRNYESRLYPINAGEALIVIRDVTEQQRLSEEKSDFIHRASHELRTPLTSAILMTDLIQEGGTPEELDEYWKILNSELNRQKILIDRLLIAGRLEDGMLQLEHLPLELNPILEEARLAIKPISTKRRVTVRLIAVKPVTVLGDKSGLQQVFINLINNAVKFSPEGDAVEVEVLEADEGIRIRISDHGLGIPADALPHLFERFYRAKNVTIAEIPGSGIGLYIVKTIVEELGGTIQVESLLNQGATFTVTLKKAPPNG